MKKRVILFGTFLASVLLVAFGASAMELSADMVSKQGGSTHTGKFYMKGDKYRMEMENQSQYTILRQDKNTTWLVMPGEKSYMEMPYDPKQKPKVDEKVRCEVTRKLLGSETIDGHPAKKYEVTVKDNNQIVKQHQWIATDLSFPIKHAAVDGSWSVEYRNIKTSVPDKLFEVPAGYTKMSMPKIPGMDFLKGIAGGIKNR
ncbi:MAG: DUF4412 domain-containing protein [Pseudomonadota bacterium]